MTTTTLEFPLLLRLIDERSAALRAAVGSAPSLDAQVPSCPEWTLFDLAHHLGEVHRFWAVVLGAGPSAVRPEVERPVAPREREALLAWSAESTELLLGALREAGPERGCWTWWAGSESPRNAGAVARRQVQEAMVHAYDAQLVAGEPEPLPVVAALDGVAEFLATSSAGAAGWPHGEAVIDYHAGEGGSWRLELSAEAVRTAAVGEVRPGVVFASASGPAADLVLALRGRIPLDWLKLDGDLRLFDLLEEWEPEV
ncbi:maleylpyruvate isomerase N-terminal domain-containing protein [Kitasatospora sp. NPDC048365]|uniref:maleylpyruvate isomerase N-terminal domain-containing protein n=1 Tax=Kitasatospora sp. NPDC048365 TaxID=3364050 RepID=UPI0037214313